LIYCTLLSKVKTWTVSIYTPGTVLSQPPPSGTFILSSVIIAL
jgi:hypothetical protein